MAFTVDEIKRTVIPKARAYGIKSVRLFGSYARGEANDFSDVDLLIDRGKLGGLVQYFSFVNELEDDFGCHVDVVTSGINDKEFLDGIIREGVLLYVAD
ncbi:MAG: nucleotidyltransferase domain-containing protein [Synergistaceae bacterium]|nr:nucleotidyltransferase domain-containing protein [Synergistaceae bacterium]MBQ3346570.1 nucleotidyltransferase domain-containing protein [Synergistaceae bacterium]MBQ3397394.1 nucleotidyltransferase domain-containing protein [Synergistaceae bacterium]MBQ3758069.1 nucleotidyltransferase domain-containing protein [Synergistaceae bacterium]MBQ4400881.1 nucleotidyltransferase domain-containing protein [Synergistaceae bacterium]